MYQKLLPNVIDIGKKAGEVILSIYNSSEEVWVKMKDDHSPVSQADLESNKLITKELKLLDDTIPIISEESEKTSFPVRKNWNKFWLIDPLDGTKEFLHRTDDFTVNIALIENNVPVLGVVVVPTINAVYFALRKQKAYKQIGNGVPKHITISDSNKYPIRVTISRRHGNSRRLDNLLSQLEGHELVLRGSTVKLCLIAEGMADIYPRLGPTSEWDTAAGQCILEAAGGIIVDLNGRELEYNRKESLQNPEFIALARSDILKTISLAEI